MADLILHHYPMSPFAEKARLMLGFKGLSWQSVFIPSVMPKPDVVALTGGYRRTPLLQIGADIYCDTSLIATVLEHLKPEPVLFPEHLKGMARIVAQWADGELFWAAMGYTLSPKGAAALFANQPPEAAQAFAADRGAMRTGMTSLRPGDATSAYRSHLRRLAHMLHERAFLLGDAPCIADFAAYHPLWFTRTIVPGMAGILEATPGVLAWMDRMAAIGHGRPAKLTSTEAIAIAAAAEPAPLPKEAFQDDHGIALGSRVTVAAQSFGTETTEGTLVAATRTHYTLSRTDDRAGHVHVHFPRIGYVLREVRA
ncbi:MAG TPA: glutathione S-transferase family protein [Hydrogenophaga sp.]|uniref:glutathione S-transferase family protein n=1 Tax=Hydrogenophaga sp. TaxID=1904254 RepID=UPI002C24C23A|nr:glutathione S-transferase family protein [Hydrogenophaga sp.]HMN91771.1 glutathione S-transferase family protein [Hydrogenophaga sp.]HMP10092.1 glutathione S-transferase family protein [Hydrogenophaga sp.]